MQSQLTYHRIGCAALLAAVLIAGFPAAAETNGIPRLTLEDARQTAFLRNWDLLAAQKDIDQATAQKWVAREFPNPTLSLSTSKISTDRGSGTTMGNSLWNRSHDTIVAVNQLFEIGGKRANRKESASAGEAAAKARFADARRQLDLAVTRAYVSALLAEENSRILKESSQSLRKEAGIAETRFKAGDISAADKAQIEIAAERLELDAESAEATARAARLAVEVLLGEKTPSGHWAPGDSLEGLAGTPIMTSQESPGALRPDLMAAEAAARKAAADARLQRSLRYPDPTFFLQYEHEPADKPNTIGVGVSFPLPLWNHNRGGIAGADAAREQAEFQVNKVRAQISAEISSAELAYADASSRYDRYRTKIQPRSEEIRKTVSFAYSKGGASLLDLLAAERSHNDARLSTAQAEADAVIARTSLQNARFTAPQSKP